MEVIMTNEEYYTLNEIYHFLADNKDKLSISKETLDKYIDTLESIAGDDEDEIIP